MYSMNKQTSACLNETLPISISGKGELAAQHDDSGFATMLDRLTEFK